MIIRDCDVCGKRRTLHPVQIKLHLELTPISDIEWRTADLCDACWLQKRE